MCHHNGECVYLEQFVQNSKGLLAGSKESTRWSGGLLPLQDDWHIVMWRARWLLCWVENSHCAKETTIGKLLLLEDERPCITSMPSVSDVQLMCWKWKKSYPYIIAIYEDGLFSLWLLPGQTWNSVGPKSTFGGDLLVFRPKTQETFVGD